MSEWTKTWRVLWDCAAQNPEPFEIDQAVPEVARQLGVPHPAARHEIAVLLEELARMPDGQGYFRREGDAVVPLPELLAALHGGRAPETVYPFEV